MKRKLFIAALLTGLLSTSTATAADQAVGKFVQLRGTATIERDKGQLPAKVKGSILASDIITTGSSSKAKMLFIDDSVMTMAENSKLSIKEFVYSKGKEGRSIYNLLDGKMRSVVGRTKFEVHTPTAVAAARGTVIYFDVGMVNNQSYSKIICLEGNVQIRNIVSTVSGQVTLTPGTMVVVKANEPPPPPAPVPQTELDRTLNGGGSGESSSGGIDSGGSSGGGTSGGTGVTPGGITAPPIQLQPIFQPRRVNINIGIPGQ
jgi:uncharacterized membrane protein YgcG